MTEAQGDDEARTGASRCARSIVSARFFRSSRPGSCSRHSQIHSFEQPAANWSRTRFLDLGFLKVAFPSRFSQRRKVLYNRLTGTLEIPSKPRTVENHARGTTKIIDNLIRFTCLRRQRLVSTRAFRTERRTEKSSFPGGKRSCCRETNGLHPVVEHCQPLS